MLSMYTSIVILEFKQYRGFCDFCKTCPPEKFLYKCLICQDDPELCEKCKNDDFRLDSCSTSHSLLSKYIDRNKKLKISIRKLVVLLLQKWITHTHV